VRALLSNSHSLSPKSEAKTFMENFVLLMTNRNNQKKTSVLLVFF